MIAENADRLACKLTELRFQYVKCNSMIKNNLEGAESEFVWDNHVNIPIISFGMKTYLLEKMKKLKQNLVNSLIHEISFFAAECKTTSVSGNRMKMPKRFPKRVLKILEESFANDKYPSEAEKILLARKCYISLKQVNNWFTNKRNRSKLGKKEDSL